MSFVVFPPRGDGQWKSPVANVAALPASNNQVGDARVVEDVNGIYIWSGSAWVPISATASAGGSDGEIQFNDSGALGGVSTFVWNDATQTITFGGVWVFAGLAVPTHSNVITVDAFGTVSGPAGTFTDGYVLTYHDSGPSWGAGIAATVNHSVIYNDSGVAGGTSAITILGGGTQLLVGDGTTGGTLTLGHSSFTPANALAVLNNDVRAAGGTLTDGNILTYNSGGVGWAPMGGTTNSIQTNNGSSGFGGASGFTFDGTNAVFSVAGTFTFNYLAGPAAVSTDAGGTLQKVTGNDGYVLTWHTGGVTFDPPPTGGTPGGSVGDIQTNAGGASFGGITGTGVSLSGPVTSLVTSSGVVTSASITSPAGDGTYSNPTSITISNGIITAIS